MDLGKRLRDLRPARGIRVADLKARTGMPRGRIGPAGEGTETPTLGALEAWAGAQSVEMHELFITGERSLFPGQRDPVTAFQVGTRHRQKCVECSSHRG